MKKIINKEDIREADNIKRCQMLIAIIERRTIYTQDIKIHKEKASD